MNVRLAAQVLSHSVGSIMAAYSGPDCQKTSSYMLLTDRLFGCLNTRSLNEAEMRRKPDLAAYTDVNDPRFNFLLQDFLGYLEKWKQSVASRVGSYTVQRSRMFLSLQTYKDLYVTVPLLNQHNTC